MAMRAFEAVVRLRSFGRAAEELGVTQSSVSQHVKLIEEWIGHRLLVRGPRSSTATKEGQMLAVAIAGGIGQISVLCEKLKGKAGTDRAITISCPPGFAVNWLFPRLMRFDQLHADTPVSISTDSSTTGFATGQTDVAIVYGLGNHAGLYVERLLSETIFPVCSPDLLREGPPLNDVADLADHTFLLDELANIGGNPPDWEFWAEKTGQLMPKPARVRRFGQANMVVQAAVQGQGVALGRSPLVFDALAQGTLVRPFGLAARSEYSYWFVCPKDSLGRKRIQLLHKWLISEAENTTAIH